MKTNEIIDVSIVVPLYNEEGSIIYLYDAIVGVMKKTERSYEMIFIDDGSKDATFDLASELARHDRHVKVVKFRRNYGQTPAMRAGFDFAKGRLIVSMDGDLQNDPADIPLMLAKMEEGYDIVCGWRKERKDKLVSRKIPSMAANWLIGKATGINIHDNGCSLKTYRSSVIKRAHLYSEMHRFIPAILSIRGIRYAEMVVNHHAREFGVSKYGLSRVWKVFLDLLMIKMLVGFSMQPAIWFGMLSLPAMLAAMLSILFLGSGFTIIPQIICFLSFFLSLHLFMMGMLSEMILKTGVENQRNGRCGIFGIL